ncbi:MAG: hypothetical protein CME31_23170 [Gimesia sp.]|nr:hypothetical protein [Gimesia sp.]
MEDLPHETHTQIDHDLPHEINLLLLQIVLYRQQRKFILSMGLLAVMISAVIGLMLMAAKAVEMSDSVENLLLIILTASATTQAKLSDFYFSDSADDQSIIKESTSYSTNNK